MSEDAGVVRPDDVAVEAWRNGRGITRTLARGAGWRLSAAEIAQDGPFSTFEGVDRILIVIDEQPLRLVVDARPRIIEPGMHIRFPGEAEVRAEAVERPVQALNVMLERGSTTCLIDAPAPHGRETSGETTILAVLTGGAHLLLDPRAPAALPPGSLVLREELFARVAHDRAGLALIRLRPRAVRGRAR